MAPSELVVGGCETKASLFEILCKKLLLFTGMRSAAASAAGDRRLSLA